MKEIKDFRNAPATVTRNPGMNKWGGCIARASSPAADSPPLQRLCRNEDA